MKKKDLKQEFYQEVQGVGPKVTDESECAIFCLSAPNCKGFYIDGICKLIIAQRFSRFSLFASGPHDIYLLDGDHKDEGTVWLLIPDSS